jgi:hypothetical protein
LRITASGAQSVPVESRNSKGGKRWDAVIADNPQPIRGALRMATDVQRGGRIVWRTDPLPGPTLPCFKTALAKFFDTPIADTDQ